MASYHAILEAAAGLFQQFPSNAIALRDILSLSGVSNQTLYNYFPAGRNDVALVLHDRFRRSVVADFSRHCRALDWSALSDSQDTTHALSASLAQTAFSCLSQDFCLQSALFHYLLAHRLVAPASHFRELEEVLAQQIVLRYGERFQKQQLALTTSLSVACLVCTVEVALGNPEFPLDTLESSARKLVQTLLLSGIHENGSSGGSHPALLYPPSVAVVGAPISPLKRQVLLARMFKRKRLP
ncbi:TetR/AcrR family transcriptional regulator [Geothrix sp. 21YS21S-4]|uniref:TetR/AcrR family transcriptional regulator n=1 Tax=Geothrix sp. 21YS21S-4 TaxID=3068889 RepID=UPI0027B90555|nr:TetR/AcrR family transcriptional regulator [Geothrix sp. 21YS21S-4]